MMAATPSLEPGDIDLWRATLPLSRDTEGALYATLCPDEQARATRFAAPSARRQFIGSRSILRHLLALYTGQPAHALHLTAGRYGKPVLTGPATLSFSLSHTEGLVLVAVAADMEVGVDVERIRPIDCAQRLAARYFTPPECTDLEAGPEGFLRLWTCRESALKACGLGISQGWDSLRIVRRSCHEAQVVGLGPNCLVRWLSPQPGYVAALAAMAPSFRIRHCETLDKTLMQIVRRNTSTELHS